MNFGPFSTIFEKGEHPVPRYLMLLGLHPQSAALDIVNEIENAINEEGFEGFVVSMLVGPNWRTHLVAGVAILLARENNPHLESLWKAIDEGSWVTPQLVTVALFSDPMFSENARSRVNALCPVWPPASLSAPERHSATGPSGGEGRRAKMLASLLQASLSVPSMVSWVESSRAKEEVSELLVADSYDNSTEITKRWLGAIQGVFAARGTALVPLVQ